MAKYKVGDKVRVRSDLKTGKKYGSMWFTETMKKYVGTVVTIKDFTGISYAMKEGGPAYWTDEMFEGLAEEEPKKEPTPTPVVNVNVTVNLYENACWYCRKGGLVDLYLNGQLGICPSCGRVCNNTVPTPKKESVVIEFKPHKENKPLTTEELKALPNGTRVFTVWLDERTKEPRPHDNRTCWRKMNSRERQLDRKSGQVSIDNNGRLYHAYLEIPEGYVDNDPF